MKKVKTFVLIIALFLVSLGFQACSCAPGSEEPIKHVYAEGITVRLVEEKSHDTVSSTYDESSKKLIIDCQLYDRFVLEYSVTPDNTTKTQVKWSITDRNLVKPYGNEGYERNATATEQVEFLAQARNNQNYTTEITFSTTEYEKSFVCVVNIYTPKDELSTFAQPDGLRYDSETNSLVWNKVTKIVKDGTESNADMNTQGIAIGLTGYEIAELDAEGTVVETFTVEKDITTFTPETPFTAGQTYSYKVKALSDPNIMNPSEYTSAYNFHKLLPATITNNNGMISCTPSYYTQNVNVYPLGVANPEKYITTSSTSKKPGDNLSTVQKPHSEFGVNNSLTYKFQAVSYPCSVGTYDSKNGYSEIDGTTVTYYYASEPSRTLEVQKLSVPTLNLTAEESKTMTIDSIDFSSVHGSSIIYISGSQYDSKYGVKYQYRIYPENGEPTNKTFKDIDGDGNVIKLNKESLSAGKHIIEVCTVGNEGNTISSIKATNEKTVKLEFTVLKNVKDLESGAVEVGDDDIFEITTEANNGGAELLFVSKSTINAQEKSLKHVVYHDSTHTTGYNVITCDLRKLGLSSGLYDVYVKLLPVNAGDNRNAVIVPADINGSYLADSLKVFNGIEVAPKLSDPVVTKDSELVFTKLNNFDVYEVSLTRSQGNTDNQFLIYIYSPDQSNNTEGQLTYNWDKQTNKASITLEHLLSSTLYPVNSSEGSIGAGTSLEELELTYDGFVDSSYGLTIRIRTLGVKTTRESDGSIKDNDFTAISSGQTARIDFRSNVNVQNIQLNNYVVSFEIADLDAPDNYLIELDYEHKDSEDRVTQRTHIEKGLGGTFKSFNLRDQEKNKITVTITTYTYKESGELDKTETVTTEVFQARLADYINTKGTTHITITALGLDSKSLSVSATRSFYATNQVNGLSLTDAGYLTWTTPTINIDNVDLSKYTYSIYFYKAEGNVLSELSEETIHGVTVQYEDEELHTDPYFGYDIGETLSNHAGEIIAITVVENNSSKFCNEESEALYATRSAAPVDMKAYVHQNKNLIVWSEVNNANRYNVVVNGEESEVLGDSDILTIAEGTEEEKRYVVYSISDKIKSENNKTGWDVGSYQIVVNSSLEATGTGTIGASYDNPYVLASSTSSITIGLLSSEITVETNDTLLQWSNPTYEKNVNTEFKITYKPEGAASATTEDVEITGSTVLQSVTYDASEFANVKSFDITVTPSIDFEKTNLIYIGSTKTETIMKHGMVSPNKLETQDVYTLNGNLTFVLEASDTSKYEIELYESGNILSSDSYTISSQLVTDTDTEPEVDPEENGGEEGGEPAVIDGEETEEEPITPAPTPVKSTLVYTVILKGDFGGKSDLKFSVRLKSKDSKYLSGNMKDLVLEDAEYTGTKIGTVTDLEKIGNYLVWSAFEGVSGYEITYTHVNSEEPATGLFTLEVTYHDNGDGTYYYEAWFGDEGNKENNSGNFFYTAEDNKFRFLIDYTTIVGNYSGDINFTIKAITNEIGFFSGNTSAPSTITILNNSEAAISIDGDQIIFAPYEQNGTGLPETYTLRIYMLDEDGNIAKFPHGGTDYDIYYEISGPLAELQAINLNSISVQMVDGSTIPFSTSGDYKIELTYNGNDNNIVDSKTVSVQKNKLAPTANLFTQDGVLNWESVKDANGYTLLVKDTNTEEEYQFKIAGTNIGGVELKLEEESEEPTDPEEEPVEPTASTLGLNEETGVFTFEPGKNYIVKVRANSASAISSAWSKEFTVHKLLAPTNVQITANNSIDREIEVVVPGEGEGETITETETMAIGVPLVTWHNPNLTTLQSNYTITYSGADKQSYPIPYTSNWGGDYYYPITSHANGSYSVALMIYGNSSAGTTQIGYLNSDYSAAVTVNYVFDVDKPSVTNGNVAWSEVNGAYSYKISAFLGSDTTTNAVLTVYTTNTEYDFTPYFINNTLNSGSSYTFVVNAITEPVKSVVTTIGSTVNGAITVYKPSDIVDFKVKDGMLNWRVSYEDISKFAEANLEIFSLGFGADAVTQKLIEYIVSRINGGTPNEDIDKHINHLITFTLNTNGTDEVITPTSATVVRENPEIPTSKITHIEYSYVVGKEPESAGETPDTSYAPGKYTFMVATSGSVGSGVPVIRGNKSTALQVFKPNTPKTWTTLGSDIERGKVQWNLSTTSTSTIGTFKYHKDYKIIAMPVDGGVEDAYTTITVADNDENLNADGVRYSRSVKDDLFMARTEELVEAQNTNLLYTNQHYKLFIYALGTADSSLLGENEPIYLNSNYAVFSNTANILDTSNNVSIKGNQLTWETRNGSTQTRLYVYGPFDNLDEDKLDMYWQSNYYDETTETYTNAEIQALDTKYSNGSLNMSEDKLRVIELGLDESTQRITKYSLTDMLVGNRSFEPGGYIIKLQELGDNKGIIDSDLSEGIACHKLGYGLFNTDNTNPTNIMQENGWVGVASKNALGDISHVYKWNKDTDTWSEVNYPDNAPNQKVGVFVWNPVAGANNYKIEIYSQDIGGGNVNAERTEYVQTTRYELPNKTVFNNPNKEYYINITALRTVKGNGELDNSVYESFADNVFYADNIDTTAHERLNVPDTISVIGTGDIFWGIDPNYEDGFETAETTQATNIYRTFRIAFNDADQYNNGENASEYESRTNSGLNDGRYKINLDVSDRNNGTVAVRIKTIALDGNIYVLDTDGQSKVGKVFLNSSYTAPFNIKRIENPDPRLIDGQLHWGTLADLETTTTMRITTGTDVEEQIIGKYDETSGDIIPYDTHISYFTEIDSHNALNNANEGIYYTAEADEALYPTGAHTFEVKFDGTNGEITPGSDKTFYVTSTFKTLNATKLNAPVVEKVNYSATPTSVSQNMIMWKHDENATGYKIKFFTNQVIDKEQKEISYVIEEMFANMGEGRNERFIVKPDGQDTLIYLELTQIIIDLGIANKGGNIHIYVQAIGSGNNDDPAYPGNNLYLSSSYSSPVTFGVPEQPTDVHYDVSTGTLSWDYPEGLGYNAQIDMAYTVSGINQEQLNYWIESSDTYYRAESQLGSTSQSLKDDRFPEIINRTVTLDPSKTTETSPQLFTIYVQDKVLLQADGNVTPTSYTVTAVGSDYEFSIIMMAFNSDGGSNTYLSTPVVYDPNANFGRFSNGDGNIHNPYMIRESAHLNNMKDYPTRHFELVGDIELPVVLDQGRVQANWTPLMTEFTGTFDGNNYSINNYVVASTQRDGEITVMSFMNTIGIGASVKNTTFNIYNGDDGKGMSYVGTTTGILAAGVAINNYGTIDNVTINGDINIAPQSKPTNYTSVGGMVIYNYSTGVINNSHYHGNITSLDESSNIYAIAGGIARANYGSITKCSYTGQVVEDENHNKLYSAGFITSNKVGGLVADNYGIIDNSFVDESITICATNYDSDMTDQDQAIKYIVAGGIAATMSHNVDQYIPSLNSPEIVRISNSYSRATIEITKVGDRTNASYTVAGLVANMSDRKVLIENSYVIAKFTKGTLPNAMNINIYSTINNTTLSENNGLSNNFYYVEDSEIVVTDAVDNTGMTKVSSIIGTNGLNAKLQSITNSGQNVYKFVDADGYLVTGESVSTQSGITARLDWETIVRLKK